MITEIVTAAALALVPAASPTPSGQDVAYLQAAHRANLAEIAGGRLAMQKGVSPGVRALGDRFVRDHTALDAAVTLTARATGVKLPGEPDAAQQALAARYAAASPATFDALFVRTQIAAHTRAMAAGRTEIRKGSDVRVTKVAADAAPVIALHHVALVAVRGDLSGGYGPRR